MDILEKKNPNIEFYINRNVLEGVTDIDLDIFPSHFTGLICGWPGSGINKLTKGKTSLLKFMLNHKMLLNKKFDEIVILSPSIKEFETLMLPKENLCSTLNWNFVYELFNKFNQLTKIKKIEYTNVLLIIDDFISELNKDKYSLHIKKMVFNRRHLLERGMVNYLIMVG